MATLCATFRNEAGAVFLRMRKSASLGMSLSEETLTEWALYNIALKHQGQNLTVELATKPEEKKHGADWEWWLVRGTKTIGFRVQAKRLFPNGRYQSLFKSKSNPYEQLDKLVSAAGQDGLIPLYCFFNFNHPFGQFVKAKNTCNHKYRRPSFWGCALAFPDQVKTAQSDQLTKLRPILTPWHQLVCNSEKSDLLSAAREFCARSKQPMVPEPRAIPPRVRRLIDVISQRKATQGYLDETYRELSDDIPSGINGVALFRDLRD
jgi:hypothetical protein